MTLSLILFFLELQPPLQHFFVFTRFLFIPQLIPNSRYLFPFIRSPFKLYNYPLSIIFPTRHLFFSHCSFTLFFFSLIFISLSKISLRLSFIHSVNLPYSPFTMHSCIMSPFLFLPSILLARNFSSTSMPFCSLDSTLHGLHMHFQNVFIFCNYFRRFISAFNSEVSQCNSVHRARNQYWMRRRLA